MNIHMYEGGQNHMVASIYVPVALLTNYPFASPAIYSNETSTLVLAHLSAFIDFIFVFFASRSFPFMLLNYFRRYLSAGASALQYYEFWGKLNHIMTHCKLLMHWNKSYSSRNNSIELMWYFLWIQCEICHLLE